MAKKKTGAIESYTLKSGEKLYRFKVYIGLDPLTGKELRTTRSKFKTIKEAELALARLKLDIANGLYKKVHAETYQVGIVGYTIHPKLHVLFIFFGIAHPQQQEGGFKDDKTQLD
jgi:hypothetical protein